MASYLQRVLNQNLLMSHPLLLELASYSLEALSQKTNSLMKLRLSNRKLIIILVVYEYFHKLKVPYKGLFPFIPSHWYSCGSLDTHQNQLLKKYFP
jgi:hypothetical protein